MGLIKRKVVVEKKAHEKFMAWAKRIRYLLEDREFDKDDIVWKAWYSGWSSFRGITIEQQASQHRAKYKPLTDEEKRQLWINCSSGKDYAERIEHAMLRKNK